VHTKIQDFPPFKAFYPKSILSKRYAADKTEDVVYICKFPGIFSGRYYSD